MLFSRRSLVLAIGLLIPIMVTMAAIWLPFGFDMTGLIEEWDVLGLFSTSGLHMIASMNGFLPVHSARPLTIAPHAIAYFLDPESFNFWHILLISALITKGVASAYITFKATSSLRWSAFMGSLVLLYPADTMQLSFRSLHINWALALMLVASGVFLFAIERKNRYAMYGMGVLATIFLFAASCMYDAALTLIPIPIFIIYVRYGLRDSIRCLYKNLLLLIIWFSGAITYMCYVAWVSTKVATYEHSVTGGGKAMISGLISSFPKLFSIGLLRSIIGGWYDAILITSTEYSSLLYLILASLIIGMSLYFVDRWRFVSGRPLEISAILRLLFVGFLLCLLGYFWVLFLPSHQIISQRTFLWAAPGAAMVWIALLALLSRANKITAFLLSFFMIFTGLGAQLFQHHYYLQISETQRSFLQRIVENFDGKLNKDETLIVLDKSNMLGHTWVLGRGLQHALSYCYGHDIGRIEICYSPSLEWQRYDLSGRKGKCYHDKNGWSFYHTSLIKDSKGQVSPVTEKNYQVSNANAVVITIPEDFSKSSGRSVKPDGMIGRRYNGVLLNFTWSKKWTMFKDQNVKKDYYKWSFGKWWSLELPVRGSGWREAEWRVGKLRHKAIAWKISETSTLYFDFVPKSSEYVLRGKFELFVNENIKNNMFIMINDNKLDCHISLDGIFEADVKASYLHNGVNEIKFRSPVDYNYYGLSAMLDWIEVIQK